MGQNLALISVYNRTTSKDETLDHAAVEGKLPVAGQYSPRDFVLSIQKPRSVIILAKVGAPVDQTIATLSEYMEPGDCVIDGGNEWYQNTNQLFTTINFCVATKRLNQSLENTDQREYER